MTLLLLNVATDLVGIVMDGRTAKTIREQTTTIHERNVCCLQQEEQ